jgi:hypothetical protein
MNLRNIMLAQGTNQTTVRVVTSFLKAWLHEEQCPLFEQISDNVVPILIQAIKDQIKVGCDQWFQGRMSIKWVKLYNHDIKSPPFPLSCPSAL